MPAFDVPATGVVAYRYARLANAIKHDTWLHAIAIHPGDRAVVHHVLAGVVDDAVQRSFGEDLAAFGSYSRGRNALPFAAQTRDEMNAGWLR